MNKLHYKKERYTSFEKFLTNMKYMFTGFEEKLAINLSVEYFTTI